MQDTCWGRQGVAVTITLTVMRRVILCWYSYSDADLHEREHFQNLLMIFNISIYLFYLHLCP